MGGWGGRRKGFASPQTFKAIRLERARISQPHRFQELHTGPIAIRLHDRREVIDERSCVVCHNIPHDLNRNIPAHVLARWNDGLALMNKRQAGAGYVGCALGKLHPSIASP